MRWKRTVCVSCLVMLVLCTVTVLGQGKKPVTKADAAGHAVKGEGCVRHGVEDDCRILTDVKTKKKYILFFKTGKKPAFDTGISFEGTIHKGPTICMEEGTPVDVGTWAPSPVVCTQEKATAAKR